MPAGGGEKKILLGKFFLPNQVFAKPQKLAVRERDREREREREGEREGERERERERERQLSKN